jgi:hypothetical protein
VTVFNLMYLLIVYDIIRNPYFYMFTDVTDVSAIPEIQRIAEVGSAVWIHW